MDIREVIKNLSCLHAVSGYEHRISNAVSEMFSPYCDSVYTDNLGNVIGVKKSNVPGAKSIMVEAHMDEIGMMITDIDENGFLYFTNIGGIDARILPGKEVVVHGKEDIAGIVGAKPPHITTSEERLKTIPINKLYIDTGYGSDEVNKIVAVGDTVTFADTFTHLGDKFISAKSQDDRTSIAVLVMIMDKLKTYTLPYDICFCACVQEEVGRRGASAAANAIEPLFAVAVDVCHATTPDVTGETFKSGNGTIITKGPNIHPALCNHAVKIMDERDIKYDVEIEPDDTGTDAWALQTALEGIPTLLFSLPLRYMHTMVETVNIDDVKMTADAIFELIVNTQDAEAVLCME